MEPLAQIVKGGGGIYPVRLKIALSLSDIFFSPAPCFLISTLANNGGDSYGGIL